MRFVCLTVSMLLMMTGLSTVAVADELPFTSVQCGDHWFKVHALIDEANASAVIWYSGDSVSGHANMNGKVTVDGSDVVITYNDATAAAGMQLVVDTFDAMHDLFWGSWGKETALSSMGLCNAE